MNYIPGFEELYSATKDGRIYSHISNKYLEPYEEDKYYRVPLTKEKTNIKYSIHRLIALTYIPNPDNKPEIDHINKNKKRDWKNIIRSRVE